MSYLLMATALAEDLRARKLADIELGDAEAIVARMLDRTGELARRLTLQADGAYDGTIAQLREAMLERGIPVAAADDGPPRRCHTNECDLDGSCMVCGADQGEYCRQPEGRRAGEQLLAWRRPEASE